MMLTYFIAQIGAAALTTNVYTKNLMMFIFVFALAIAQGTQILIGYMVGSKKMNDAYQQGMRSLKISAIISLLMAAIIYILSKPLIGIFTDNESIISTGSLLLALTII